MTLLLALSALAFDGRTASTDDSDVDVRAPERTFADPIINGVDATADDYPQAGAMMMDAYLDLGSFGAGNFRSIVCSSTLIAPDVVMLAAHCLDEDAFTYGMGSMEINEVRWSRQADLSQLDGTHAAAPWPNDSIVAIDWETNRNFSLNEMGLGVSENYDIALLFLETPVLDTPFAYIPTVEETDQIEEGTPVTVVGWGQQVATDAWESPEEGDYAIKQMGDSVVGLVGEFEFQVGPDEDDVRKCHGDSGGPTFIHIDTDTEETMRVIGVTSHSFDNSDCNETGGVDTRVMAYREWIENQMVERCEDGTRVWCDVYGLPEAPLPEPEVVEEEGEEEEPAGCGCSSTADGALWLGLGAAALLVARRRG